MTETVTTTPTEQHAGQQGSFSVSDNAAKRIAKIAEMQGNPDLMLRITISGGGCSGFQYGFKLDDQTNEDDLMFEHNGIQVVIDDISLGFLEGGVVDFKEDLGGSYFQITNPNATASCGCGSSFSI